MCMRICMCACAYACTCTYARMYTCICECTYTCTCMYVCVCVYVSVCVWGANYRRTCTRVWERRTLVRVSSISVYMWACTEITPDVCLLRVHHEISFELTLFRISNEHVVWTIIAESYVPCNYKCFFLLQLPEI